ncbi:hypothetical protein CCP3SC1AL1_10034 [Gammaproteobacteria bacterium]
MTCISNCVTPTFIKLMPNTSEMLHVPPSFFYVVHKAFYILPLLIRFRKKQNVSLGECLAFDASEVYLAWQY